MTSSPASLTLSQVMSWVMSTSNPDDLRSLNVLVYNKLQKINKAMRWNFPVGSCVQFVDKKGSVHTGTVVRINPKRVKVMEQIKYRSIGCFNDQVKTIMWNCSPGLLQKVDPKVSA